MEAAEYPIVVGILLTISILGGTANSLVIALFVRNKKASPLYCLLRSTLRNFYYLVRNLMAFFFFLMSELHFNLFDCRISHSWRTRRGECYHFFLGIMVFGFMEFG